MKKLVILALCAYGAINAASRPSQSIIPQIPLANPGNPPQQGTIGGNAGNPPAGYIVPTGQITITAPGYTSDASDDDIPTYSDEDDDSENEYGNAGNPGNPGSLFH